MMRIILVRHGQTEWNAGERAGEHFRGRMDIALNALGHRQAQAVGARLAGVDLGAVYASPLRRAMATARPIAEAHGLRVVPFDGLLDIDYGQWSGRSHRDVAVEWPDLYRAWRTVPHQVRIPGGESLSDVRARVSDGLATVVTRHDGEIVAHQPV